MKTLRDRFWAEMPTFWRRAQKLALFGLGAIAAIRLEPELIPDTLLPYLKHAFVFFTTIAATAQLTCKDVPQEENRD
jgi:hypothetical protein